MRDAFYVTTFICHLAAPIKISNQAYFDNVRDRYEKNKIKTVFAQIDQAEGVFERHYENAPEDNRAAKLFTEIVLLETGNEYCRDSVNLRHDTYDNLSEGCVCLFFDYVISDESSEAYSKYLKSRKKNSFELFWHSVEGEKYQSEIDYNERQFQKIKNTLDLLFSTIDNEKFYTIDVHSRFFNALYHRDNIEVNYESKLKFKNMYFSIKKTIEDKAKDEESNDFFPDVANKLKDKYMKAESKFTKDKIEIIGDLFHVYESTSNRQIQILELVSIIEFIVTRKSQSKTESDSIRSQFKEKTYKILSICHDVDQEKLMKELAIIYDYRSSFAHGDIADLEKHRNKYCKYILDLEEYNYGNKMSFDKAIETLMIARLRQCTMLIVDIYLNHPSEVKQIKISKKTNA